MRASSIITMPRFWIAAGLMLLAAGALLWGPSFRTNQAQAAGTMPEFTTSSAEFWINSAPLKKSDLRGKVVLLEIWTSV